MNVKKLVSCALLTLFCCSTSDAAAAGNSLTLRGCPVIVKDRVEVPAQEPGVLSALAVREGDSIEKWVEMTDEEKQRLMTPQVAPASFSKSDEPQRIPKIVEIPDSVKIFAQWNLEHNSSAMIARIDAREFLEQYRVARLKANRELTRAANDIKVRYAMKASAAAAKAFDVHEAANNRTPGTYSELQIDQLRLEWESKYLQIENSEHEQTIARMDAQVAMAEVEATQMQFQRSLIKSPVSGVVVELFKHAGEWVQPGEKVAEVISLERLYVTSTVNHRDTVKSGRLIESGHDPSEIMGKDVTATVELAGGREVVVKGKIVFCDPRFTSGGEYRVLAEIVNRQDENGRWYLNPGQEATMVIHLK